MTTKKQSVLRNMNFKNRGRCENRLGKYNEKTWEGIQTEMRNPVADTTRFISEDVSRFEP